MFEQPESGLQKYLSYKGNQVSIETQRFMVITATDSPILQLGLITSPILFINRVTYKNKRSAHNTKEVKNKNQDAISIL